MRSQLGRELTHDDFLRSKLQKSPQHQKLQNFLDTYLISSQECLLSSHDPIVIHRRLSVMSETTTLKVYSTYTTLQIDSKNEP